MSGLSYLLELFDDFTKLNRHQKEYLGIILASNAFENSDVIALVDHWIIEKAQEVLVIESLQVNVPEVEPEGVPE